MSSGGSSLWPGLFVTRNPEMPEPEVRRHRTSSARHSGCQRGSRTALGLGWWQGHSQSWCVHPGVCHTAAKRELLFQAHSNTGCWERSRTAALPSWPQTSGSLVSIRGASLLWLLQSWSSFSRIAGIGEGEAAY